MGARGARKITSAGQAEATASMAIDAIEASAWLLDQLGPGELGSLAGRQKPPCWLSVVGQSGDELATTLQQIAIETIGNKTQELREAMRVLHPAASAGAA
jgi:hypothetical protein